MRAALALVLVSAAAQAKGPMPTPWSPSPAKAEPEFSYSLLNRQSVDVGNGDVEVRADNGGASPEGAYIYLRVSLNNKSPAPQPLQLSYASSASGDSASLRVDLGPSERRTVVLPVPSSMAYGALSVSGPGIREGGKHAIYFTRPAQHFVLVVGTEEHFQKFIEMPPSYAGTGFSTTVMTVAPDELAAQLAPYIGFDEVVLLDVSLSQLDDGPRAALEAYAATGGTLVLAQPGPHPGTYLPLFQRDGDYGFGHVAACAGDCGAKFKQALTMDSLPVRPHGPVPSWMRGRLFGPSYMAAGVINPADVFLLPEAAAPLGRFLLIIFAFSLAIGPGSIWLARKKGPPAVLLFIPATALVTCLSLVGYSLIHDGFTLHSATRSVTLLDRKNGRAVTLGLASFYANLAPSHAQFDTRTALVFPGDGQAQTTSMDWSQGVRMGSGFIPSRTYREWGVMTVQPFRGRVIVKREGDRVRIRNALGSPLRLIHFSYGGKLWRAADLRDGGEGLATALESAEPVPPVAVREYESRFESDARFRVKAELEDGEFLADLEGPGMLPLGGLPLTHDGSEALVRGTVDGP